MKKDIPQLSPRRSVRLSEKRAQSVDAMSTPAPTRSSRAREKQPSNTGLPAIRATPSHTFGSDDFLPSLRPAPMQASNGFSDIFEYKREQSKLNPIVPRGTKVQRVPVGNTELDRLPLFPVGGILPAPVPAPTKKAVPAPRPIQTDPPPARGSKKASSRQSKPAAPVAEKPAEKPVEKPVEKPAEQPARQPAGKTAKNTTKKLTGKGKQAADPHTMRTNDILLSSHIDDFDPTFSDESSIHSHSDAAYLSEVEQFPIQLDSASVPKGRPDKCGAKGMFSWLIPDRDHNPKSELPKKRGGPGREFNWDFLYWICMSLLAMMILYVISQNASRIVSLVPRLPKTGIDYEASIPTTGLASTVSLGLFLSGLKGNPGIITGRDVIDRIEHRHFPMTVDKVTEGYNVTFDDFFLQILRASLLGTPNAADVEIADKWVQFLVDRVSGNDTISKAVAEPLYPHFEKRLKLILKEKDIVLFPKTEIARIVKQQLDDSMEAIDDRIKELVAMSVRRAGISKLSPDARVDENFNWLNQYYGTAIDSVMTTGTNPLGDSKSLLWGFLWLKITPAIAMPAEKLLEARNEFPDASCWVPKTRKSQITYKLAGPVYPNGVAYNGPLYEQMLNKATAPRKIEVWAPIHDLEKREALVNELKDSNFDCEAPDQGLAEMHKVFMVCIGKMDYDLHGAAGYQPMALPLSYLYRQLDISIDTIVFRVVRTYGEGSNVLPCLYQYRLFGDPVKKIPDADAPEPREERLAEVVSDNAADTH